MHASTAITEPSHVVQPGVTSQQQLIVAEEAEIQRIIDTYTPSSPTGDRANFDVIRPPTLPDAVDDPIVGIDLGTTHSSVSIWRNGRCEVLADDAGTKNFPSVISFGHNKLYIGAEAKHQIELNPENTFHNIKRIIGRSYTDPEVQKEIPYLSYTVTGDDDGTIKLIGRHRQMHPEEVSSLILLHLKKIASDRLGCDVKRAVITVPAYFTDGQRTATQDAARIAGIDCVRIINEPTAAALAYGMTKRDRDQMLVLVYDLGGGTLDVTLMRINMTTHLFQVLASVGNSHMGGEDFDNRLVDYCRTRFKKQYALATLDDLSGISLQTLKRRCEQAKRHLSTHDSTTITVPDFYGGYDLKVRLTRKQFEYICKDLFIICMKPIDDIMRTSAIDKRLISEIVMVGGCTRIPMIIDNLRNYFDKEPNSTVDPDLVVSIGASIMGYMCSNTDDPFSSSVLLLDVTPLSIGIETTGGTMSHIIRRGTVIPTEVQKRYTTDTDNMQRITIRIYEGERELVKWNRLLGSFDLELDYPALRGVPQIMVTVSIDSNGILDVSACDVHNESITRTIRITGNKGRLTPDEVARLVTEAQECMLADELHREIAGLRYQITDMCAIILENIRTTTDADDDAAGDTVSGVAVLRDADRSIIVEDVARVKLRMQELLDTNSIEVDRYRDINHALKKRYATLILRKSTIADTLLAASDTGKQHGVNIYNDDCDSDVDDNDDGATDSAVDDLLDSDGDRNAHRLTDAERSTLVGLRQRLITLYTDLRSAVNHPTSTLSSTDKLLILDAIDDAELWVHVVERPRCDDYQQHIDELNAVTNTVMHRYDNPYTYQPCVLSAKEQLENTCYALRSIIAPVLDTAHLPTTVVDGLHDDATRTLVNYIGRSGATVLADAITETIDWIIATTDGGVPVADGDYLQRLANINQLTDHIYQQSSHLSRDGVIGPVIGTVSNDAAPSMISTTDSPTGSYDIVAVTADDY